MQITINKQSEHTIEVPVPCYWTNGYRWTALIQDESILTFAVYEARVDLEKMPPNPKNVWLAATQESDNYRIATEDEFFEAYDEAIKSITITPILKTW